MNTETITPPLLRRGATVAIVSPASAIDPALIEGACAALTAAGYNPEVMPHAASRFGSYSASEAHRLADLEAALANPEVGAILCSRGGYGAVHLLGRLQPQRPVWLIGFSDISALHALWLHSGLRSVHASMAKELALRRCPADEANRRLLELLATGRMPGVEWGGSPLNRTGRVEGTLLGGNLAVLNGLASTPYDMLSAERLRGAILIIEDIAEPIYKVERVLHRLRLSGALDGLGALIVGRFTDYRPGDDGLTMERMIARTLRRYDFPMAFNAPFGHIDGNLPFMEGCRAELRIDADSVSLRQIG